MPQSKIESKRSETAGLRPKPNSKPVAKKEGGNMLAKKEEGTGIRGNHRGGYGVVGRQ